MRVLPLVCTLVVACRGLGALPTDDDTASVDEDGTDATTDGGGTDEDPVAGCRRVCFAWADPPQQTRPSGTLEPVVVQDCNHGGYDPTVCPDDFTCGEPVTTWYTDTYAYTRPLCEAASPSPVLVVADLPAPGPPPDDAIAVTLVFTLLGAPWPVGAAGSGGTLTLDPVDEALDTVTVDMPVASDGVVEVALVPGDYAVAFQSYGTAFDSATFPVVARSGTLRVVKAGEEDIDIEAVPVPLRVLVDGERLTAVPPDVTTMNVSVWSPRTGTLSWYLRAGDPLPTRVLVPPSTYDATVTTSTSADAPTLPNGTMSFRKLAEVTVDGDATLAVPLDVVDVSGTIRVDGAALPAGTGSSVRWESPSGAVWIDAVRSGATSSYAGRVYAGTYDVLLDTRGDASNGLPRGVARVASGVVAGPRDLTATTAQVSGTVKVNGAQPTGSGRGAILFVGDDGDDAELTLASFGAATFSGAVWSGRGTYVFDGGAYMPTSMPLLPMVLRTGANPATGLTFDLDVEALSLTFTVDGRSVTDGSGYRGGVLLTGVDGDGRPVTMPGVGTPTAVYPFATSGGLVATGNVPHGTWQLDASPYGLPSLPEGSVRLHDGLAVSSAVTRTFDRATLDLRVEVLTDGARPDDVGASKHRGVIAAGLADGQLPATGRAVVDLHMWRGAPVSVVLSCDRATGCASGLPAYLTLWDGLAFPE